MILLFEAPSHSHLTELTFWVGLNVHMNQVHKETLANVENALPNRQGLDIEIFGMEGIPGDVVEAHNQRVIQQHYADEQERAAVTGNPVGGSNGAGAGNANKRPKFESPSDLKKRLAEHKARKAAQEAGGSSGDVTPLGAGQGTQSPGVGHSPGGFVSVSLSLTFCVVALCFASFHA